MRRTKSNEGVLTKASVPALSGPGARLSARLDVRYSSHGHLAPSQGCGLSFLSATLTASCLPRHRKLSVSTLLVPLLNELSHQKTIESYHIDIRLAEP